MTKYLIEETISPQAMAGILQNPEDRSEVLNPLFEAAEVISNILRNQRGLKKRIKTAIGSNDVIIRVLAAYILGVSNGIYRRFEINSTSLSVIGVANNNSRLITLNDTSHLGC